MSNALTFHGVSQKVKYCALCYSFCILMNLLKQSNLKQLGQIKKEISETSFFSFETETDKP